jgi:hypothetical protein
VPIVPRSLTKPKLLVGEGIEEERFFKALLLRLGIYDVQVESYNGKDHLASYLKSLPKIPGFDALVSLGVTRDADLDAVEHFREFAAACKGRVFLCPTSLGSLPLTIIERSAYSSCLTTQAPECSRTFAWQPSNPMARSNA